MSFATVPTGVTEIAGRTRTRTKETAEIIASEITPKREIFFTSDLREVSSGIVMAKKRVPKRKAATSESSESMDSNQRAERKPELDVGDEDVDKAENRDN